MTTLASVCDNAAAVLAADYTAGSGAVRLAAGPGPGTPGYGATLAARVAAAGFPPISAAAPLRFTLAARAALTAAGALADPARCAVYTATGLAGDTLTGVAADPGDPAGPHDQDFSAGDVFGVAWTARQVRELQGLLATRAADDAVVHAAGDETVAGVKTFTSPIAGSVTGSAATITGSIPESQVTGLVADLAARVTTSGSYHDPPWLTGLSAAKLTGALAPENLPPSPVTPGTYTNSTVTVDPAGRVTAAASGAGGGGAPGGSSGQLQYNNAGAFGGADLYAGAAGGAYTDGSIQVRGNTFGSLSGAGAELYFSTPTMVGGFVCYDRSRATYLGFRIDCDYEAFCNWGVEAMRLTGGRLGIGTASPQALLHLHGGGLALGDHSATGAGRLQGRLAGAWAADTDATRAGRLRLLACDWTGADREGLRVESDGARPLLGFFGAAAAARPVLAYSRAAAGETAAAAALRAALAALGLVTDSTTP